MSRWRPPSSVQQTALITAHGLAQLKTELDHLWREQRPSVVAALAAAAAEGDRSENAEYTYRKKQLADIDRRVRYLSQRLPQLRSVTICPHDQGAVFFGATVTVQTRDGSAQSRFCLVGPDESDPASGKISIDSPLARALLHKRVGDSCTVDLPTGEQSWTIVAIHYENNDQATQWEEQD